MYPKTLLSPWNVKKNNWVAWTFFNRFCQVLIFFHVAFILDNFFLIGKKMCCLFFLLQDLVGKLKDAAKSVEKASQMWWLPRCPVSLDAWAVNRGSFHRIYFIPDSGRRGVDVTHFILGFNKTKCNKKTCLVLILVSLLMSARILIWCWSPNSTPNDI